MRITLSGDLGSGKSSVGSLLAERLGVPHYSAGSLFREIGQISNLDALNTNLAAENNVDIDHQVDGRTREIDRTVESFVIDSRMAWHFVSDATKVYLSASPETAAERVIADKARSGETYDSAAAAMTKLAERRQSEQKRYQRLYGVDISDVSNYDLFIITDDAAVDDIADLILTCAAREASGKFWLPKTRVVPMVAVDGAAAAPAPAEAAPVPLTIADNFGFFFGDARSLTAALAAATPFVAYEPSDRDEAGADLVEHARRTLRSGDLKRWEQAFAIAFAFRRQLENAVIR